MSSYRHVVSSMLAFAIVSAAVVGLVAPNAAAAPIAFPITPVSGWSVNGTVWAVVLSGGTVYVGGDFTQAYAPGGSPSVARSRLAAFDAATGALLPSFVADANGSVRSLATDGTTLFVGGGFTQINGVNRTRVAAVDASTGSVRTGFTANAQSWVYALEVSASRLFIGGSFSSVNGVARARIAAVDAGSGAVQAFNPNANNTVESITAAPNGSRLYVAGRFTNIGGANRNAVAALDATSGGALTPVFRNTYAPTLDLDISPDGTRLFGAVGGAGNQAAAWNTSTGARIWANWAEGDVQAIAHAGGNAFFGFHEGFQGDTTVRVLAADAATGGLESAFRPTVNSFWGVRSVDGSAEVLVIGGEFTQVSGQAQRGLAIFRAGAPPPTPSEIVSSSTVWRYSDTGADLGTAWASPAYNDGSWASGSPQFGYGDGDEATVISYGPNANNKFITSYFRTSFNVSSQPSSATIYLIADDGARVFLNGTEVVRDNLPVGTVGFETRATSNRSGAAENLERSFPVDPSSLQVGNNTLAVDVHQDVPASSDVSFSLRLVGLGGGGGDTTPPSVPANLHTTSVSSAQVDLAWNPSTDNVGVAGYDIYRGVSKVGESTGTAFSDTTVLPSTSYQYTVRARDGAGNVSAASVALPVMTPAASGGSFILSDGFESGNLSNWTTSTGMSVQSSDVFAGSFSAIGTATSGRAFASRTLSSTYTTLSYETAFKIVSKGSNAVNVQRFQAAGGANILTLFVSTGGNLMLRNDVTGSNVWSSAIVPVGGWHEVETQVTINGGSSTVRVLLDGSQVNQLTQTLNLGTNPIGRLILGDNNSNRTHQMLYDEVAAA